MASMRDPVCGRIVTEETAQAVGEYRGQRHLFCSRGCKIAFEKEPEACLTGAGVEQVPASDGPDRWACRRKIGSTR